MATDSPTRRAIATLAARQHGNVTRQQLLALGLGPAAIAYRVRIGELYRVHLGVYAVGRPPSTPLEWAAAAVLACGPTAALSNASAMSLWGFFKSWGRDAIEVIVVADRRPRGITTHRSRTLARRDIRWHHGIRVTSPARTIFDMVPRLAPSVRGRIVNDALLSPYLHEAALAEIVERFPHHAAAAILRPLSSMPGGPTRSVMEDDFVAFCGRYNLPRRLTNVYVGGYLVDAYFPEHQLIVELDSYEFHSSRAAFENDRNRDADALLAGIATVRVTWERIKRTPDTEAVRLQAILDSRRPS